MGPIEIGQLVAIAVVVIGLPVKWLRWDRQRVNDERAQAKELGAMRQKVDDIHQVVYQNGLCQQVRDCAERISRVEGILNRRRSDGS